MQENVCANNYQRAKNETEIQIYLKIQINFMLIRRNSHEEANQSFFISVFPIKLHLSRQQAQKGNYPQGSISFALYKGKHQIDSTKAEIPCDFDTDGQMQLTKTDVMNSVISTCTLNQSKYLLKVYLINLWLNKVQIGKTAINIKKIIFNYEQNDKNIEYTLDPISDIYKLEYQVCIARTQQQLDQAVSNMRINSNMLTLTRSVDASIQFKIKKIKSLALQTLSSENQNDSRFSQEGFTSMIQELSIKQQFEDIDLQTQIQNRKSLKMSNHNPEQLENLSKHLPKKTSRDQTFLPEIRISRSRSQVSRCLGSSRNSKQQQQKRKISTQNKQKSEQRNQQMLNVFYKIIIIAILLIATFQLMSPSKKFISKKKY